MQYKYPEHNKFNNNNNNNNTYSPVLPQSASPLIYPSRRPAIMQLSIGESVGSVGAADMRAMGLQGISYRWSNEVIAQFCLPEVSLSKSRLRSHIPNLREK